MTKEWASKALGVQLNMVTGKSPQVGCVPSLVFPMHPENLDESKKTIIWIWSHTIRDGDGHRAEHFDLLSEDHYRVSAVGRPFWKLT